MGMYRGSVIQQPSQVQKQPVTRPQSQSLQPGMLGYNAGNMYGNNDAKVENKNSGYNVGNMYGGNEEMKVNDKQWEDAAPPPAYASAPPQDEVIPSAPPCEEEGAYT